MKSLHICVAIPTYNGEKYIGETLRHVLQQDYRNFSVILSDDGSNDNTLSIARSYKKQFKNNKIQIIANKKNIGCSGNFRRLVPYAKADILFLLCQDDLLLPHALKNTAQAFQDPSVGVVTRPYYWFDEDMLSPQRVVYPISSSHDVSVHIQNAASYTIEKIVESVGQASGLAYRIKNWTENFHDDIFVTHIYPFFAISRKMKLTYLHDYTIAVRIKSSQSRNVKSVYKRSPTFSWIQMFDSIFSDDRFQRVGRIGKTYMLRHFVGLVQIRNYSTYKNLVKEIYVFIVYKPQNLLELRFWFYSLLCLLTPRFLLQHITDAYKEFVLGPIIKRQIR